MTSFFSLLTQHNRGFQATAHQAELEEVNNKYFRKALAHLLVAREGCDDLETALQIAKRMNTFIDAAREFEAPDCEKVVAEWDNWINQIDSAPKSQTNRNLCGWLGKIVPTRRAVLDAFESVGHLG